MVKVVRAQDAILQRSGTSADDFLGVVWTDTTSIKRRKGLEFAELPYGTIGIRNGRFSHGPVLIISMEECAGLFQFIKCGALDGLISPIKDRS